MARREHAAAADGRSLSLAQTMMLQGVIPIVLVGIALPIGLIALVLAIENAPVGGAFDHGALFLAAGNAAFIGCVSLIAARSDRPINAMIASMVVLVSIVVPAYACWAVLTVRSLLEMEYSQFLAVGVGGAYAALSAIVALVFVWLSYRPPAVISRDA